MRHPVRLLIVSLCLVGTPGSAQVGHSPPTETEGLRLLDDLWRDAWKGIPSAAALGEMPFDTDVLTLERDGGWLHSRGTFYDYVLTYETRLADGGRHRLFFRTLKYPEMSYELRFDRHGRAMKGELIAKRRNQDDFYVRLKPAQLAAFDSREWHKVQLRCVGRNAVVMVNGIVVLALDGLDAMGGDIGFAGEKVSYRWAALQPQPIAGTALEFLSAYDASEEELQMPEVVKVVKPVMPRRAAESHHDYSVWLEAVVDATGRVVATRFLRRLQSDIGYNEEAVRAIREWQFTPGRLDGQPVPVKVTIEVSFLWK